MKQLLEDGRFQIAQGVIGEWVQPADSYLVVTDDCDTGATRSAFTAFGSVALQGFDGLTG